ncbi:ferric reductase-like transmembrane domain-containing protein [Shimia isoporae]|uniref:ferric reductase-like transmembrane domain-containing protein n=1 Tax=Shimia isoporae TaxID=647720 RepID=UPI001FB77857|nr:ferric reductase-like transmembrane domain-containing protein [Shimia isoporae]
MLWSLFAIVFVTPLALAGTSPLLAWRSGIYIAASFAGIIAFGLCLLQPLLATAILSVNSPQQARRLHRLTGTVVFSGVLFHISGLWITSPPDVIDALLLRSPTPFSIWGVLATWALLLIAFLAVARRKLRWPPQRWGRVHLLLATILVTGAILHVLLIEGTMEPLSKFLLCLLLLAATLNAVKRAAAQKNRFFTSTKPKRR